MYSSRIATVCFAVCLIAACKDGGSSSGETSGTDTGTTTTETTTSTVTSGMESSSGAESSTGPMGECGNGEVEADEICDDANRIENDGCTSRCQSPCGPEWVTTTPAVDSGNQTFGGFMDVDGAGNIAVLVATTNDDRDLWVAKYQPDGTGPMWSVSIDSGNGNDVAGGLAADAAGDLFLVGTFEGTADDDAWYARLAGDDGSEMWSMTHDGALDGSDDEGLGVALASDGLVVSGTVFDVDADSDVWVRKVDLADGSEIWTSTHTGMMDNGFSIDHGGPVAVGPDDAVYVLAQIYVNFETNESELLKFAADGTPDWTLSPLADGMAHRHTPQSIVHDGQSHVYALTSRFGVAEFFWLHKVDDAAGTVVWDFDADDIPIETDFLVSDGVDVNADRVAIGGSYVHEMAIADVDIQEGWAAQLDLDGGLTCMGFVRDMRNRPLLGGDLKLADDGAPLMVGWAFAGDGFDLWLSSFATP